MKNYLSAKNFFTAAVLFFGLASGQVMAQTPNPLACTTTSYLFQSDVTDIYEVDLTNGKSYKKTANGIPGIATGTGNTSGTVKLNAFGFNQADNYIWGVVNSTTLLARIGKDNSGNYLGQTFSVPNLPVNQPFVVGDVSPSGKMYLTIGGSNSAPQIYVIDLTQPTNSLTATTLTTTTTIITDWAVSPLDNNLYAISTNVGSNSIANNGTAPTLYRFLTADRKNGDNTITVAGTREVLGVISGITSDKNGTAGTAYNFGSAFMDVDGSFYGVLNSSGAIYRIDKPNTLVANSSTAPVATYVNTPNPVVSSANTDGARCSAAKVVPLPVTLTSFVATATADRSVQLTWTTANEQNNDFFEVQYSTDGQAFAAVGRVAGHQTTTQASAYSFVHAAPGSGATHYYRLRQVDLDGTSTFSPVRTVALAAAPWQVTVAPNPTSADALRVQVQAAATAPTAAVLEVRSLLGQCVFKQAITLQPGDNSLALSTSLAPGLYWLGLTSEAMPSTKGVKVLLTK